MHICQEEILAALAALPFVGYTVMWVRHRWHRIWHRGSPKDDGCCREDEHEHKEE